ncbi:MAG: SDR family oxidoreductase [Mycobacteriales bacterium]
MPVLSPTLSSRWVGLVTPVPSAIARPLVESLRYEVICTEDGIRALIPDPPGGRIGYDEALRLALLRIREAKVLTRWSNAAWPGAPSDPLPTDPDWAGGSLYVDDRSTAVDADCPTLWRVIEGIGGEHGWYSWPLAWAARGWLDRLAGGVGLRRGRRDPQHLLVGETVDFWRVEEIERGHLLRLRAEMRVPGLAWLEMRVQDGPDAEHASYHQRAIFHPRGLAGHAYWWAVKPFHGVVFGGMQRNIARAAAES